MIFEKQKLMRPNLFISILGKFNFCIRKIVFCIFKKKNRNEKLNILMEKFILMVFKVYILEMEIFTKIDKKSIFKILLDY